jgi:hypothetical protein
LSKEAKLVNIFTSNNHMEANVIKGLLESADIPAMLKPGSSPSVFPFSVDGLGVVEVLVHEENADKARELIEAESSDA